MYERIRHFREDNDIKQVEMARQLNIHQSTYSDYELGKLGIPIPILSQIADIFGTSTDYLINRTDTEAPYPRKKSTP